MITLDLKSADPKLQTPEVRAWLAECERVIDRAHIEAMERLMIYGSVVIPTQGPGTTDIEE